MSALQLHFDFDSPAQAGCRAVICSGLWEDDAEPVPPDRWTAATKRPETLAMARCPHCECVPATLDPLPPGWTWDTMEPTNPWAWCPDFNGL